MRKKELSIKIDYLSIIFESLRADELIRKVLGLLHAVLMSRSVWVSV